MVRKHSARFPAIVTVAVLAALPLPARAYDAVVGWEPVAGAAGYRIDVRIGTATTATSSDVGNPAPSRDGVARAMVRGLGTGPDAHFTVTAYDANGAFGTASAPRTITYAAQAAVSDSDNDGLSDADEDRNLNGVHDPGETDAKRADTDGDGVSDGDEIAAGTDPLSPPPPPPAPACPSACDPGTVCDTSTRSCVPDARVWIVAARDDAITWHGAMTRDGAYASGRDADPAADALASQQIFASSTTNEMTGASGDEVRYTVTIPSAGEWYVWGRFYYPGTPGSNDANSFYVRVGDGPVRRFGNNKNHFQTWHWDGDGAVETGSLVPLSLGALPAGTQQVVVEKREVAPIAPRLDVLVLTRDPGWAPSDAAAIAALGSALSPTSSPLPPSAPPTTTSTTTTTSSTSTTTSTTTTTRPAPPPACSTGESCDDGDPCTVGDACQEGTCSGWPLDCSHLDGDCSVGACDPLLAECVAFQQPAGTPCDDGSGCTDGDACTESGSCSGELACAEESFCDQAANECRIRAEVWVFPGVDPTAKFAGAMTASAEYADGDDLDPLADSITPTLVFADSRKNDLRKPRSGDEVAFRVKIPAAGEWYLWARLYYPGSSETRDANSFFVRLDDGPALTLGDNREYFQTWHWDGDGSRDRGTPTPLAVGWLEAGFHDLTVAKREARPVAPRLDVIVMTQDPDWVPSDDLFLP